MKRIISWYVNYVFMFRFLLINPFDKALVFWNGWNGLINICMFCSSVLLASFYVWFLVVCQFVSCFCYSKFLVFDWKTILKDSGAGFVCPCRKEKTMPKLLQTQLTFTCSKSIIETLDHWRRSGFFIFNFEHISHLFLVILLLTLNK